MEVRHPDEFTLLVVTPQRAEKDVVRVEIWVAMSPLIDALRRLDVPRGGPSLLVPRLHISDDQVRGELIHKQQRRELHEQGDSVVERVDMVEHARCDDCVPGLGCQGICNLLKLASQIAIVGRRSRVNAHDVIATIGEVWDESSLVAAAHLEHTCRWGRQVTEHERQEIGGAAHCAFVASRCVNLRALALPNRQISRVHPA